MSGAFVFFLFSSLLNLIWDGVRAGVIELGT